MLAQIEVLMMPIAVLPNIFPTCWVWVFRTELDSLAYEINF